MTVTGVRVVAVGDVYDALRSRRVYKPALSQSAALHLLLEGSPGQFDPALLQVFRGCAGRFEQIFRELVDEGTPGPGNRWLQKYVSRVASFPQRLQPFDPPGNLFPKCLRGRGLR